VYVGVFVTVGVLVTVGVFVAVKVGVDVNVLVGVAVLVAVGATSTYEPEVVVAITPPSPVGEAPSVSVYVPAEEGLLTPLITIVTLVFLATATGALKRTVGPPRATNEATFVPAKVADTVVVSVPAGKTIVTRDDVVRLQPFVFGTPVVSV
jgi:hypothetical protein